MMGKVALIMDSNVKGQIINSAYLDNRFVYLDKK
jgi:hypothetical protein